MKSKSEVLLDIIFAKKDNTTTLISFKDAARMAGPRTSYKIMRAYELGELHGYRIGCHVAFLPDKFEDWLRNKSGFEEWTKK